ncbi:unnamed protein product [Dracunculus medinensis]|uniref:Phosphatidylserine synthase n=1 Tax=Dracunculus medinensis TaxID=318479 RepID=A0A0N4ULJ2_DRAME|nr:unnamed protein product [Dracunculus medinensis]
MSLNRRHRRNLADATYETGINTSSEDLYHSDDHYQNTDSDYDVSDRTYANYSELRPSRHLSRRDIERINYRMINERVVEDVTIEFFYKPRTISVLVAICAFLLLPAFLLEDVFSDRNVLNGFLATFVLFIVISALAFPNGPFIRPHPVFWRIVFGISVTYVMLLQFALFQNFADIKSILKWLDPERLNKDKLDEKEYAINCSDVTLERMWSHVDIFAVAHFLGWAIKALLIRHSIICWYISIAWELTEVFFAHLLPNFQECWWDAIILDVLICNGLGIWVGIKCANFFEIRQFHWESVKDIKTTRGKFKRAVLQFTPESWIKVDWYKNCAIRRTLTIYSFVMIWLVSELNTFFLKHIFAVDTSHPLVSFRLALISFISAPTIRQFYMFATDPRIKRMGMQSWVYLAICVLEAAVCVKFGRPQLPPVKITLIVCWIAFMAFGTFACVWLSVWWVRASSLTKPVSVNGCMRQCYIDSSYENLGVIADDVKARRKKLNLFCTDSS